MRSGKEFTSRAERWEQASRDAVDQLASLKIDSELLERYGQGSDPFKWAAGKLGLFSAKAIDTLEFAVQFAMESAGCKSRNRK